MPTDGLFAHDNNSGHIARICSQLVVISKDGPQWFAEGVHIDYAACGDSIPDVRRRFKRGLTGTIRLHRERFGTIERLLRK